MFAILQAVKLLNMRNEFGRSYTVFSDSQAAVARVQHTDRGPAQALASAVVDFSYELWGRGNSITVRWTPAHQVQTLDPRYSTTMAESRERLWPPGPLSPPPLQRCTRHAGSA